MNDLVKILIVDDEQNILDAFRRNLPRKYNVDYCSDPSEALRMVETGEYNVVFSDISMPGLDGITFFEKVNEYNNEIVKVIITGFANIQNTLDAINKSNVFRFLSKPITSDVLIKTVEDSITQYRNTIAGKELFSVKAIKNEMESMIGALAKIVEIRDPYTAGHQKNVADMSVKVAKKLGWHKDRINGLYLAAIVHDIGKIYVPSEFLNKPGRLSETEFSLIKQHPTIGHEILSTVNFRWPISTIVHQHHEKDDGSGYPQGLTADDIIEEARVLALCDIYDAMVSHRPYRPALTKDETLEYLKSIRNIHYNELYVDTILEIIQTEA